ncbi:MAG: histidine phosphatase family protein [Gammaproteobacteria bacterium]|nr:histidine phosphatase family protein [Gammaproteobacteria bacterium]MDH5691857.1 histidine phosphatase family protein [Gammaproteobacteria bacterium]
MRSKEKSTTVYYVRHGVTDFPIDRIYCDSEEDPALSRRGRLQAKAAATFFQNVELDAIYASPAARTLATAGEIADVTGNQIEKREGLRERPFGIWDGLYFHEIEERYPEEYLNWKKDKVGYTPEGGETINALLDRLNKTVSEIIKSHEGQTLAIVSHVGPIRMCVTQAFQIPVAQYRQINIDYASITRIDYGKTLNNLIFLNQIRYI